MDVHFLQVGCFALLGFIQLDAMSVFLRTLIKYSWVLYFLLSKFLIFYLNCSLMSSFVYQPGVWREWWSREALSGSFFISQRRNAEREGANSFNLVDTSNWFRTHIAFVLIAIEIVHGTLLSYMINLGGSNWWMWIGLW